ncbi:MAG: ATP-binding protein [Phycisphaerae bacterium]|nr:ATP-binding protein [Phycisphaerae bacterium]
MVIPSELQVIRQAALKVLDVVKRCGYDEASAFGIRLALEEALHNAVKHGNRTDPAKVVKVDYDVDRSRAILTVTDQGQGFDPAVVPDPTTDENLERPSGRGIMLMRAYMDQVHFNGRGNQVRMVKQNR